MKIATFWHSANHLFVTSNFFNLLFMCIYIHNSCIYMYKSSLFIHTSVFYHQKHIICHLMLNYTKFWLLFGLFYIILHDFLIFFRFNGEKCDQMMGILLFCIYIVPTQFMNTNIIEIQYVTHPFSIKNYLSSVRDVTYGSKFYCKKFIKSQLLPNYFSVI